MYLGSDDGAAVFLNGERVHYNPIFRSLILDQDRFGVRLDTGENPCLVKISQGVTDWEFAVKALPSTCAVVKGTVTAENKEPMPEVPVTLYQKGWMMAQTETDDKGDYQLFVYPVNGRYDVSAVSGKKGIWQTDVALRPEERRQLDLTLRDAVSIAGTVRMLDETTPHVALPVEAVEVGHQLSTIDMAQEKLLNVKVAATVLSNEEGRYQFVNLFPGAYLVRCQTPSGFIYYGESIDGEKRQPIPLQISGGESISGVDFRFASFKKGTWKSYRVFDGLPARRVNCMSRTPDGRMWFGTQSGGSCGFDGTEFESFRMKDGVRAIETTSHGVLWFGAEGGVSRYDGESFTNFTTKDGLVHNWVNAILLDNQGGIWFGTEQGVSLFDGSTFTSFTMEEGLVGNTVTAIRQSSDGTVWFGTKSGLSAYNGKGFVNFTTHDGLVHDIIHSLYYGEDDALWIGTVDGISRFHRQGMVNFTAKDGLPRRGGILAGVAAIHLTPDKEMWVMTENVGVLKFDGEKFQPMIPILHVRKICQTSDGALWLVAKSGLIRYDGASFEQVIFREWTWTLQDDATGAIWFGNGRRGGGVKRYEPDTGVVTTFTVSDGLSNDIAWAIETDADDVMWIGTDGGLCRYDGKVLTHETKGWDNPPNVRAIHIDTDGVFWFGGSDGVFRYDREGFIHFTDDGIYSRHGDQFVLRTPELRLPSTYIQAIYRTEDGITWFGTDSHGIVGYDGAALTTIDTRDGIAGNSVSSLEEYSSGFLWIGTTDGGLTRYRRNTTPPGIRIRKVTVDDIEHTDLNAIQNITAGHHISIFYQELDFKTHPQKRQYQLRIRRGDGETVKSSLTKEKRYDWTPKKPGSYTFEVKAIDRDLNYSQPASVTLTIVPLWYRNGWIAIPSGGAILAMLLVSILFASRYYVQRQESQRLREQMLEQEQNARRTLEQKNLQLEKSKEDAEAANQAKSIFLANMSHEIRTPMNAILGYAEILRRTQDLSPEHRSSVETIANSGEHLLELINEVLDLSRIEAGRLELQNVNFELNALIKALSVMFAIRCEQKELLLGVEWEVVAEDSDEPIWVHGDENKLRQSLINLLSNAVKFTDEGSVTLRITLDSDAQLQSGIPPAEAGHPESTNQPHHALDADARLQSGISPAEAVHPEPESAKSDSDARLQSGIPPAEAGHPESESTEPSAPERRFTFHVIDTGIGISEEEQAKIFEPFQRGKTSTTTEGTGLGLAITQKRVELMGGTLSVESPPLNPPQLGGEMKGGPGSRFFFTAPFGRVTEQTEETTASVKREIVHLAEGHQVQALVVDDVAENRDVLAKLLSDIGVEVQLAENGQEAIEQVRSKMPDIVFMDIRMPVMGGLEAAQQIWKEFGKARLKIVSVSASTLVHQQEKYLSEGFDAFISKPFHAEKIYDCLASLLHIEYVYADEVTDSPQALDFKEIALPEDSLHRLRETAELYMVTELKLYLNELNEQNPDYQTLITHLLELVEKEDMETILNVLEQIIADGQMDVQQPI